MEKALFTRSYTISITTAKVYKKLTKMIGFNLERPAAPAYIAIVQVDVP